MARYQIQIPVKRACGSQIYEVDAEDEDEALAKHMRGESEFSSEEIEVSEMGTPEITQLT